MALNKRGASTVSPGAPKHPKSAIRHQIQVNFQSEASKLEFLSRLDGAKQRLFPSGGTVDNFQLLSGLLELLDGENSSASAQRKETVSTVVQPMLDSSGKYA